MQATHVLETLERCAGQIEEYLSRYDDVPSEDRSELFDCVVQCRATRIQLACDCWADGEVSSEFLAGVIEQYLKPRPQPRVRTSDRRAIRSCRSSLRLVT